MALRDNSLLRSAASYGVGTTLYKAHTFALVAIFAFAFSAGEVGTLEVAAFAGGLGTALASFNLTVVVSERYARATGADRPGEVGLGLTTMLLVSGFWLVLAVPATFASGAALPELDGRRGLLMLSLVGAVLNALVGNMCVLLQLRSSPRGFNVLYSLWTVVVLGGTLGYVVLVSPRAEGFAWSTVAAGVVCTLAGIWYLRRELGAVLHLSDRVARVRATLRSDLRVAAGLLPLTLLGWALLFSDRKILSAAAGVEEVGVYGLAVRVANGATVLFGPLMAAWWDRSMNEDADATVATVRRLLQLLAATTLTFVLGAWLAGQSAFRGLLGDWFRPGVRFLPTLIVCAGLIAAYSMPSAMLTKQGRYRPMVVAMAAAVGVNVVLNLALDHRYGAAGASLANLAAYVTQNVVIWLPARDELRRALDGRRVRIVGLSATALVIALLILAFPSALITGYG